MSDAIWGRVLRREDVLLALGARAGEQKTRPGLELRAPGPGLKGR